MKINVHIERLILDGVAADRRLLRQALTQELTRQLIAGGLSPELRRGGAVPRVHGGEIEIGRQHSKTKLGSQIAGAVYRGIGDRR